MTVYCFNRGIGWASSGVEYAQAYRAKLFRRAGISAKFIFTDLFTAENYEPMTKNIGFLDEEVIWLYGFFTDFITCPCNYCEEQLDQSIGDTYTKYQEGNVTTYQITGRDIVVKAYHPKEAPDMIWKAEHVTKGRKERVDYYTSGRIFSEFYGEKDGKECLQFRRFYNQDGSRAYEELVDGKNSKFRFEDRIIGSKEQLIGELVKVLRMQKDDVALIDRYVEIATGVFENCGEARVGTVVHAEHFNANQTDEDNILWNNFYEYDFGMLRRGSFAITSTESQTTLLREQMTRYWHTDAKVYTIPVGSVDALRYPESNRRRHSLMTASRLAGEKHIDDLVRAAALARETVPDLTLDIYGKGGEEKSLRGLIRKLQAGDYIHLCGHQDLRLVYQNYEGYAAASWSEGFGLTLLEAVAAGLPMIGFDVRYGNKTFIENGVNGYRIPFCREDDKEVHVKALAEAMVLLFTTADWDSYSKASYALAANYTTEQVEQAWVQTLEEVTK